MENTHKSLESYTEKEKWNNLNIKGKIQYIFDYYKLPIIVILIVLYIIGYSVHRYTSHKDIILHTALINIAPSEELTLQLSDEFMKYADTDSSVCTFQLHTGWYLTDDPSSEYLEYTAATRMKILASIDNEQLDVVLMNQEAFDAFSQNGYLYNLEELLKNTAPELYQKLQPYLVTNIEILEDNAQDLYFDPSLEYTSTIIKYPMGIDLREAPIIKEAGFEDTVYLGIIRNSPRMEKVIQYLQYLYK